MQSIEEFYLLKDTQNISIYLKVQQIASVSHYTNEYIIVDKETLDCVVVDPAFDGTIIYNWIKKQQYNLKAVLISHGHADHVGGLSELLKICDVPVYITEKDKEGLYNGIYSEEEKVGFLQEKISPKYYKSILHLENGDVIDISNNLKFKVLFTPGHTQGSASFVLCTEKIIFVRRYSI